ncbi:MAG: hypothetical protein KAR42_15615 [candidate division Zixibacteria bacterium]|nr:hypothetical protein [candidate division Zixibacteria bacterium]
MAKYKNSTLRTVSLEGGTDSDMAIEKWNSMNWMERFEISQKVHDFKSTVIKQRACINYVAEFIL